ncbi:DUF6662 family protein [Kordiimonas marina]|uniref:DUF6662 family protein n=1 Tax=Kordiimonas marina TaxID=2872312 RepID=UPI001FF5F82D|nr:DUF6662 family protein [Kordiimonas marina]MCJ9428654.1 hypothetical protein [Kordiimonas marina]
MTRIRPLATAALMAATFGTISAAHADESLLGRVKSAEVLPKGAYDLTLGTTWRQGKDRGSYDGVDVKAELEYGLTNRFQLGFAVYGRSVRNRGLLVDGYLPQEGTFGPKLAAIEVDSKYNFLSPAKDDFGLSLYSALSYGWMDQHSGQDKNTLSLEMKLLGQKYFMEGQMIWMGGIGFEGTYADRAYIPGLPEGFDWPIDPETELEITVNTGLSYRFAPSWYIGAEIEYQTEFETEVGQERWSVFAGPSIHYGGEKFWMTATWLPQLDGGGERYPGQTSGLHLIEKTKNEFMFKIGMNF